VTLCQGRDANLLRLAPEFAAVIDFEARLILPLMHHLVKQGLDSLAPSVASDVTAADDNLRLTVRLSAKSVVAES
jgi:hypothetical protein